MYSTFAQEKLQC